MSLIVRLLLVALVCGALPVAAWGAPDTDAQAKEHFRQGTVHYNLGRFDEAIRAYKKAYELSQTPVLLFNIAQAYRLKGDLDQALFFYRSYLRNLPKAPNKKEVLERISALQKLAAARDRAATAPPTGTLGPGPGGEPGPPPARPVEPPPAAAPPTPPPVPPPAATPSAEPTVHPAAALAKATATQDESRPIYRKWWFWTGIGVVVVGVVVGSVLAAILPTTTLQSSCAFGIGHLNCAKGALR
jgi:tetratricopeptide (TPR) repeat protein